MLQVKFETDWSIGLWESSTRGKTHTHKAKRDPVIEGQHLAEPWRKTEDRFGSGKRNSQR